MDEQKSSKRAPNGSAAHEWRLDPRDVRRHEQRMQRAQSVGPLGRLFRYGAIALALAAAFAAYWNFETLRGIRIDVSELTALFSERSGSDAGSAAPSGEIETGAVEATGVAGVEVETSLASERPPVEPEPDEPPAAPSAAPPASAPELPDTPETFDFGLRVVNASEGDASAALLVLRNGGRRRASSVTWWTTPGTATPGTDYAGLGPLVERFSAGEQNRTIHVPLIGDRNAEGPETFHVHVAPGETDASAEPLASVEVVINDDD
jgi:hypothetical protein